MCFFVEEKEGIRDVERSGGRGGVYEKQIDCMEWTVGLPTCIEVTCELIILRRG